VSRVLTQKEIKESHEIEVTGALTSAKDNIGKTPKSIMRVKSEAGVTEGNVRYCHIKMMNTSMDYNQLGKM
jgi:hypothetical protein